MRLGPVPGYLLSCREPHVVERCEVLDNPLERSEPSGATDPPRMKGDCDVGAFALQTFLANDTAISLQSECLTYSKALIQCCAKASSEPICPCQNLKSFCSVSSARATHKSTHAVQGVWHHDQTLMGLASGHDCPVWQVVRVRVCPVEQLVPELTVNFGDQRGGPLRRTTVVPLLSSATTVLKGTQTNHSRRRGLSRRARGSGTPRQLS